MKFLGLNGVGKGRICTALVSTTALYAAGLAAAPLAAQDADPVADNTAGEIVVTSLRRAETL